MPIVPMKVTYKVADLGIKIKGKTWHISNKEFFEKQMKDYRLFVGSDGYLERSVFGLVLLFEYGLKEESKVLDIGCGALNLGRVLIPLLNKGCYYGIEPNSWLIEAGFENELGQDIISIKDPMFDDNINFDLDVFNTKFNFIVAHSIFTHAPMSDIKKCLSQVKKTLESDGVFIFSFVMGNRDTHSSYWIYPGIHGYVEETMKKMICNAGLTFEIIPRSMQNLTFVKSTHMTEN